MDTTNAYQEDAVLRTLILDICALPALNALAQEVDAARFTPVMAGHLRSLAATACKLAAAPLMARWPGALPSEPDGSLAFTLGRICAAIDCDNRAEYNRALAALACKLRAMGEGA